MVIIAITPPDFTNFAILGLDLIDVTQICYLLVIGYLKSLILPLLDFRSFQGIADIAVHIRLFS